MSKSMRPLQIAFYRGNHRDVLDRSVDSPSGRYAAADIAWVVGALSFSGRLDEAKQHFERHAPKLPLLARCEAAFHLGVGLTRHSRYDEARACFLRFASDGLDHRDPRARFFIRQGLGFFRYFHGRFRQAARHARSAYSAAVEARFLFGKSFASDLLGHSLIQIGEISAGLKAVSEGVRYAGLLGDGGLSSAFGLSLLCYRAQFGVTPGGSLAELEKLVQDDSISDNYSQAGALLELGRQYRLRGDLRKARLALDRACPTVYSSRHRRYGALLSLRYASIAIAEGDRAGALNLVRSALKELDPAVDLALVLEARGLERKALLALGMSGELETNAREIARLTLLTDRGMGRRILSRATSDARPTRTEDPLGDLIDRVATRTPETATGPLLEEIVRSGYLGLAYELLGIERTHRCIYVDSVSKRLLILDRGNVSATEGKLTPQSLALLARLRSGNASKSELIETIWGYRYHPLRHDPTIYRAIGRLRTLLGEKANWIQITETGYRLDTEVRIHVSGSDTDGAAQDKARVREQQPRLELVSGLNYRQLQALRHLKTGAEFLDVRTYRTIYGVAEMTARRDLVGLMEAGRVLRIGKGRAVRYTAIGR